MTTHTIPEGPFEPACQDTIPFVDTCEWEKHVPEHANSGGYTYLRIKRRKTVREVHAELKAIVCPPPAERVEVVPDDCDEYFDVFPGYKGEDAVWPEGRIVVFPVTGSSEGDYIHVEVQGDDGKSPCLILGKTFAGRDAAWRFARRLADLLGV